MYFEFVLHIPQVSPNAFHLFRQQDLDPIAEKMSKLRRTTVLLTFGPTLGLTTSRVLSWAIRSIAFEAEEPAKDEPADAALSDVSDALPSANNDPTDSPTDLSIVPFSDR